MHFPLRFNTLDIAVDVALFGLQPLGLHFLVHELVHDEHVQQIAIGHVPHPFRSHGRAALPGEAREGPQFIQGNRLIVHGGDDAVDDLGTAVRHAH